MAESEATRRAREEARANAQRAKARDQERVAEQRREEERQRRREEQRRDDAIRKLTKDGTGDTE